MLRAVTIVFLAAALAGCSSAPAEKTGGPVAQLSANDTRMCAEEADFFSTLAMSRENGVTKRQAINSELKRGNAPGLDRAKREELTNKIHESAMIAYALPDFSPETLYDLRWSQCKGKVLDNREINYAEILSIKEKVMKCQQEYTAKDKEKRQACVDTVFRSHSMETSLALEGSGNQCRKALDSSIRLHKKAVGLAKKGKKKTALDSLEASLASWKKIARGELSCSTVEKAIAADGILRADQDINTIARAY